MLQKRYWLFIVPDHDPEGGIHDFHKSFNTVQEAKKEYEMIHNIARDGGMEFEISYPLINSSAIIYDSLNHSQVSIGCYSRMSIVGYGWVDVEVPIKSKYK